MRRLSLLLVLVLTLLLGAGVASTPAQAGQPLPRSMAAIGDSMTRAADACCWYGDHPANSWSTGYAGWDGVRSHYERLRALQPAITGNEHNDAVSGAKMAAGPSQAQQAVDQRAEYVTILLGANDACTSAPATMTSVDTYRAELQQTLQVLFAGLPARSRVFVASVPDVYGLWKLYHTDPVATLVWDTADICQSLLGPTRTEADRQAVRDRVIAYNDVLQTECAGYRRCRYDGGAVFAYQFSKDDVSKLDYFHPSLSGQAALASITWSRSWWA